MEVYSVASLSRFYGRFPLTQMGFGACPQNPPGCINNKMEIKVDTNNIRFRKKVVFMQFSRTQLIFVLILYIGISNHVLIMPHLLSAGKRDAWVSVLISYGCQLIFGFILNLIMKKNSQRLCLYDWIKAHAGVIISRFFIFIFVAYVLAISAISFYDLIQSISIYFLPRTPLLAVMLPFLIISTWSAVSGLKSIVYCSAILLPIVWLNGIFVGCFTMEEKDYSYLFPVLVNGYAPVLKGTVTILGGSADLFVLLLLHHHLKKSFTFPNIFLLITILVGLIMGPTLGALSSFGPSVASNMRFPGFEQWRLITLGEYVSHVDFLAAFQMLSGAFIRVSLGLYLLGDMLKGHKSRSREKHIIAVFSMFLGLIALLPLSDIWIRTMIGKYFYPVTFLGSMFILSVLFVISRLPVKKGLGNI